jgi:hypothetical protein
MYRAAAIMIGCGWCCGRPVVAGARRQLEFSEEPR